MILSHGSDSHNLDLFYTITAQLVSTELQVYLNHLTVKGDGLRFPKLFAPNQARGWERSNDFNH